MCNYERTCKDICNCNLVCNYLICLLPLQSSVSLVTFQMHFGIEKSFFQKLVRRMKLFLSLQFSICHIANIGCENMFSLVLLSKSKFFTRIALVLLVQHSCCTCIALVQHSCRTCIALMLLMSHLCCTHVELVSFALHTHRSCLAVVL